MLATGCRIGEILALRWSDLELDGICPPSRCRARSRPRPEKGTYRKPTPKSDASRRTVVLPRFAAELLRVRREFANPTSTTPSSPPERHLAPGRQHRAAVAADPQGHRLRVGDPPHVPQDGGDADLRGNDVRARLRQLGHSSSQITRDHYIARPPVSADLSELLERLAESDDARPDSRPRNRLRPVNDHSEDPRQNYNRL